MWNSSSKAKKQNEFWEIGRDLLAIEICTIASDSITGRKMPWFPHALIDILEKYSDWFVSVRSLNVGAILALSEPLTEENFSTLMKENSDSPVSITNGWQTIEQLRRTAKKIADDNLMCSVQKDPLDSIEKGIALRIRRNCDQLKSIVLRFRAIESWQPYLLSEKGRQCSNLAGVDSGVNTNWSEFRPVDKGLTREQINKALENQHSGEGIKAVLDADAATRLRKIWELGTDRVIAQTLVQIDGDTITRFQRDVGEEDRKYLLEIHNQSVRTAVQQWNILFDTFVKLFDGIVDRIFGRTSR